MNMAITSHNPYAVFAKEGPQVVSGGFGGPRFSWKARIIMIATIVFVVAIGGAFRIKITPLEKPATQAVVLTR